MVWADLAGGDEGGCGARADGYIEQTVTIEVAEFASVFFGEFDPAETVDLQANTREAQGFRFQCIHGNQARAMKEAG